MCETASDEVVPVIDPKRELSRQFLECAISDAIDQSTAGPFILKAFTNHLERIIIETTLIRTGHNQSEAARILGIKRTALAMKARKHGITRFVSEVDDL